MVLSGCETGLGRDVQGEGLISLTRGFIYAGTLRVVASPWNVSDIATAQLMGDFYRAMLHDGKSPADALRSAQVKMLRQGLSANAWTAYVINGDST